MPHFPMKKFEGRLYTFDHLAPSEHLVPLSASRTVAAKLHVTYSIHCFTEAFDAAVHMDHHRYTHADETRAFDMMRYECSFHLPGIISNLARAKVYHALQNNYTYVVQIPLEGQQQPYSLFFTLKNVSTVPEPLVRMYVQSAYVKPLTVGPSAQSWRFGSLLGQLTGIFSAPGKKERPKKKAP